MVRSDEFGVIALVPGPTSTGRVSVADFCSVTYAHSSRTFQCECTDCEDFKRANQAGGAPPVCLPCLVFASVVRGSSAVLSAVVPNQPRAFADGESSDEAAATYRDIRGIIEDVVELNPCPPASAAESRGTLRFWVFDVARGRGFIVNLGWTVAAVWLRCVDEGCATAASGLTSGRGCTHSQRVRDYMKSLRGEHEFYLKLLDRTVSWAFVSSGSKEAKSTKGYTYVFNVHKQVLVFDSFSLRTNPRLPPVPRAATLEERERRIHVQRMLENGVLPPPPMPKNLLCKCGAGYGPNVLVSHKAALR